MLLLLLSMCVHQGANKNSNWIYWNRCENQNNRKQTSSEFFIIAGILLIVLKKQNPIGPNCLEIFCHYRRIKKNIFPHYRTLFWLKVIFNSTNSFIDMVRTTSVKSKFMKWNSKSVLKETKRFFPHIIQKTNLVLLTERQKCPHIDD